MRLQIYFFVFVCLSMPQVACPFSYDFANYAAQKGEWKDAHARLNNIIINNPDSADVLHDAGVAAYKLGDFSQAVTCFTRAAECAHDDNLRFDAYFKAGNASVDVQDLQGALEMYDKALAIKPDDEYARHNRDRVKQMLDEQKKEDDKKDKQEENDKKEDQEKQDKQDQDKKDQGDQNQQSGDGDDQKKDKQKNQQDGNSSDKKSQGDQGDDAEHGDKDAQRQEHGDKQQQQKKPADDKKGNGDHKLDEKPGNKQSEREKQQGDKHGKTPEKQKEEKQNATSDTTSVSAEGEQEQGKDDNKFGIDDPWLLNVLNSQELRDKAINKQLMEAKIHQHGGKNGQNCW